MIRFANARPLGAGVCEVLAEAGQCMEGDVRRAIQMVHDAADAGAWGIKVQLLQPDKIATDTAEKYWDDDLGTATQQEAFAAAGMIPYDGWGPVRDAAAKRKIAFVATPFDLDAVAALEALDVDAYKIASGDLLNIPLLDAVCATGRPILLATGAAWDDEVDTITEWMRLEYPSICNRLVLLACSLVYPTPQTEANLGRIASLKEMKARFSWNGTEVGYSDHTVEPSTAMFAATAGAVLLEKHYTYANAEGPVADHGMAVDPSGLRETVMLARRGSALYGNSNLVPTDAEMRARIGARRGVWMAKDVRAGDLVDISDSVILRPCPEDALPPDLWYLDGLGMRYAQDLSAGDYVRIQSIEMGFRPSPPESSTEMQ